MMKIREVIKRDKRKEPFAMGKIERAVVRAGKDTGEYGKKEAAGMMREIEKGLLKVGEEGDFGGGD
jgi:transcriptional regulator NrdR family protein